jgi:hypothetical protein
MPTVEQTVMLVENTQYRLDVREKFKRYFAEPWGCFSPIRAISHYSDYELIIGRLADHVRGTLRTAGEIDDHLLNVRAAAHALAHKWYAMSNQLSQDS